MRTSRFTVLLKADEKAEWEARAARRGDLQSIPETEGDVGGQATAQAGAATTPEA